MKYCDCHFISGLDSSTCNLINGHLQNYPLLDKLTAGEVFLKYWEHIDSNEYIQYNLLPCTRENLDKGFKEIDRLDLADKLTRMKHVTK